jgi:hypothetical protein
MVIVEAICEGVRETGAYVDLSGLFEAWGAGRRAIVDDVHYSPGFNGLFASSVDRQAPKGAGW